MAGSESRNGLPSEIEDLLAVHDQDGVATEEVAHLLAEAQGMNGRGVTRHGLVLLGGLLGVEDAELPRPRRVALGVDLALSLGAKLLEHGARIACDGHVHVAVVAELGRVDIDVNDLEVRGEAGRTSELDDPVEARAYGQHHVGLGEGLAAGVQEGEVVILGDEAARDRGGVEGDSSGLHERLEGGGAVGPPDPAARDDDRPLRLAEERDGVLDGGGVAEGARRGAPRGGIDHALLLDLLAEHVAGQIEIDGAGASCRRLAQRCLHHVGNTPCIVDPFRPLGDGTEHRDLVDFLEGLHAEEDARARAADGEHGRRVGESIGDTGQ
jgi:hypothetical protein